MRNGLGKFLATVALLVLSLGLVACELLGTLSGDGRAAESDRDRLEELRNRIEAELGEPVARRVSSCRAIAFGSKPCGGPWEYLIYSTEQTDEARLRQLVSEYNALEEQVNAEEGRASDCMYVAEPALALEDGFCVVRRD